MSGYYEWTGEAKARQPHHIVRADRKPFAFAGLWEWWKPKDQPDSEAIEGFTILTTASADPISHLHDLMPVAVAPGDFDTWIAGDKARRTSRYHRLRECC